MYLFITNKLSLCINNMGYNTIIGNDTGNWDDEVRIFAKNAMKVMQHRRNIREAAQKSGHVSRKRVKRKTNRK